jgi:predicted DNA-binding mobile mystery protein A
MGLTRQGVADLERREVQGAVTLNSLQKAARAMNAVVVYAIVPRQSLAETIRAQARAIAEKQLKRVDQSMLLEAQDVSREEYANQLAENQDRLLRNWSRQIWDEEDVSRKK